MEQNNLPAQVPDPQLPPTRFSFADAADYDEEKSGPGLKQYLRAVLRYKWLVLLLTIAGTAGGVFLSRQVTLTYAANAVLFFQQVNPQSERQGPIRSTPVLLDNARGELLRSQPVLEPVVRANRLYVQNSPLDADVLAGLEADSIVQSGAYTLVVGAQGRQVELRTRDGMVIDRVSAGEPVGGKVGLIWTPPVDALRPGREVRFQVLNPAAAASRLGSQLRVTMPQRSNLLSVGYEDPIPERAAAVVNGITENFVRVATELKRVHLVNERDELRDQLDFAEANLQAALYELNQFLVSTATLPSQSTSPVTPGTEDRRADAMNSFFDLQARRDQIVRDREAIERALDSDSPSVDALSIVASVQQSPELTLALQELTQQRAEVRSLLQRLTEQHPQVIAANAEVANLEGVVIPRLARGLISALNTQVGVMSGMVDASARELQDIPPRAIAEAGYRRTVASAERIVNDLRQRFETARLAAETTQPDVTSFTPASVPQQPNGDTRMQVLLLGFAGGLGAGIGIAILLGLLDRRVRYAEQVSDGMHLTILGAIPDLSQRRKLFSANPDRAELVEALRGIRLNLTHAYGSAGPVMLTITSPGPGDGKTFLTTNLGTIFAELGMRTLIIDADTRRGTMHHVLKIGRKPGLTDYLSQKVELHEVIRPSPVANLDVLPSGTRLTHAPDLLASSYMGDLLAYVRSRYDVVLVDSPPLGAGVDPLVLATATGNVMLVMRTGKTDRTIAEAKLAILDRLPVRVLGAVLNGIAGDTAYKYYSYLPGYEAGEEDSSDRGKLLQPA